MTTINLDKIFAPTRIAVVGASNDPSGVGYTILRNLIGSGFSGVIYPVNPTKEAVQGIQAYADVKSLPRPADLAVICTPAKTVPGIIAQCGEMGIMGIIIISAGFKEIGAEGKVLEEAVMAQAARFPGMRILGPNCLGIIVPTISMNASFATAMPAAGSVAVISQSGALCTSLLDWALEEGIGFSYFVSIGNKADIEFGDLIDYFGGDSKTTSIILYIESVRSVREFMSAARAFSKTRPIVAFKSGRFAESAKAAGSHTGAMAGADDVYDAAFQRAGIERVMEIDDIFDCAELLGRVKPPQGARLAIVTNAGGPGVMATDSLIEHHGVLARLGDDTLDALNKELPPFWSHGNPVDVLGDAPAQRLARATEITLSDPGVDASLVILTPQAMTDPSGTSIEIGRLVRKFDKPILAAWMGGLKVREGIRILNQSKVPTYTTPEQGVRAFMHLVSYKRNLEILYETPKNVPVRFTLNRQEIRDRMKYLFNGGERVLSEIESKDLVGAYGIPVTKTVMAGTADEAVKAAGEIGYPVVLKIYSPDITHKTDAGGIALNLHTEQDVSEEYDRIMASSRSVFPKAVIDGVTVQPMVSMKSSTELILGAKRDVTFGSVIMLGMGGITAELLRDRVLELPPLNERLARRMLESLASYLLLVGYRGRPQADIDGLIEILIRFSYLIADYPEIKELDINPLVVSPDGAIALDARVIVDEGMPGRTQDPYYHLAIRPYPEEYERPITLADGTNALMRPIKPEDEPLWIDLLNSFSKETIRFRFFHPIREITHEMATRYCYIDYDREIGVVVEVEEKGEKHFVGVGRLILFMDKESGEFAVAVTDAWQRKGAGSQMIDFCIEMSRRRGVKRISTVMLPDNTVIIKMFERRGFTLTRDGDLVKGELVF
ncbi:MAG: bifunctional acetate--CoA ligase family protein/GNAT family N-acetyltransferase [Deltaproteobacteria bacterium]|nr:bifunctional acetate--CoA ligase family protein/GNAT family N-acetyltransferase [Candidatus Zymogenaceae bacterium]